MLTHAARRPGKLEANPDVGPQSDRNLGHRQSGAWLTDAAGLVHADTQPAAHRDPDQVSRHRLGVLGDELVEVILGEKETEGFIDASGEHGITQHPDIGAGAEPPFPRPRQLNPDDVVVVRPGTQLLGQLIDHRPRERVDPPWPIQRQRPDP